MITKVELGNKWSGQNLGNQLFLIASMYGLAKRYKTKLAIPETWKYTEFFKLLPEIILKTESPTYQLKEQVFHYDIDFFDKYAEIFQQKIVNITGILQTEKYWCEYTDDIKNIFTFQNSFKEKIFKENAKLINTKTVAISVRRGDFITNPNHYLLPFEYYTGALEKYFSNHSVVIFTDDFKWCKKMFSKLSNKVYYSDKYNPIEQLCFMSMFSNFIISNSTFSWWGVYLSRHADKKVVRPYFVFDGELKMSYDIKDHYPDEWIVFRHEEKKRNKIIELLFYNDNSYRFKRWCKIEIIKLYHLIPLPPAIKKMVKRYSQKLPGVLFLFMYAS